MKKMCTLLGLVALSLPLWGERPNVVVIMADDMGYADTGVTGSRDILTPNLDKLAKSGVVFTKGYVTHPFCGPSRAGLLSGRYQHRFGMETNPAYDPSNPLMGIDPGEKLFPERLQEAGYVTGGVGKWHLGAAPQFQPNNRGFDYFYGFLGGGHDYFEIDLSKRVGEAYYQGLVRNNQSADFEGYLTTALSRDAASFIAKNKEKPFFLYLAYNAPHTPLQAPAEDIARYAHIKEEKRRIYAAMVDVMDRGIGEVMKSLEENGLRKNTLVFFLSDNGGPQNTDFNPKKWNGSSNGEFRGGKGDFYEGGVHVPFFASWPAKIPAGTVYEKPVIALDIARTAVAVAGADATTGPAMEGVDLIPFLRGEKEGAPHQALFWRYWDGRDFSVLASNGDKHVRNKTSIKGEFYQLSEDASEAKDLIVEKSERAEELMSWWKEWDEQNVANRFPIYIDYHKKRAKFYGEAVEEKARKEGYVPEIKLDFH